MHDNGECNQKKTIYFFLHSKTHYAQKSFQRLGEHRVRHRLIAGGVRMQNHFTKGLNEVMGGKRNGSLEVLL